MKTTKKPAACSIHKGPEPTRAEYAAVKKQLASAIKAEKTAAKKFQKKFAVTVGIESSAITSRTQTVDVTVDTITLTILPPHTMPPYGGPCWRECYAEAQAYIKVCKKTAELRQAAYEYSAYYDATSRCLNGWPV